MSDHVDFNPVAAAYEKYRVGYGDEVFAAIAGRLDTSEAAVVLDLACGTGLSTVPLRKLTSGTVIGADIAGELMARAPRVADGKPIAYIAGNANQLPFAADSLSAITCGQALHWMDPDIVMPEVVRTLARGGWFFAYWKYPAPDEPYQLLANDVLSGILGRKIESRYTLSGMPDLRSYGFGEVIEEKFELPLPFTVETYVGFMRSRRRIMNIAGDHREGFLERYAVELEKLHPHGQSFEEMNEVYLFGGWQ